MARLRLGGIHRHANEARGVPPLLGPLILLLPNVKSVHRLTDAWPADCAYLLSVACRIAYSQNAFVVSLKADHNFPQEERLRVGIRP